MSVTEFNIVEPVRLRLPVTIRGLAPLMTNRMSDEARAELENPNPRHKASRGARVFPGREAVAQSHLHIIDAEKKRYGIPTAAVYQSMVDAACNLGIFKTRVRGIFRIESPLRDEPGLAVDKHRLLEIRRPDEPGPYGDYEIDSVIGKPPTSKVPMPIHRPRFNEWEIDLFLSWNSALIEGVTLLNLLETAGDTMGIGPFRPQCEGEYGIFTIKDRKDVDLAVTAKRAEVKDAA